MKDFNIQPGFQEDLLSIMKEKLQHNDGKGTAECILSFDEMHLKERWVYDQHSKRALIPAKKLQCIFVRGIISGWKTPIYLGKLFEVT